MCAAPAVPAAPMVGWGSSKFDLIAALARETPRELLKTSWIGRGQAEAELMCALDDILPVAAAAAAKRTVLAVVRKEDE